MNSYDNEKQAQNQITQKLELQVYSLEKQPD